MEITAPVRFISALHNALARRETGPASASAGRIVQRALADGWITPFEIENLLIETDCRLWQIQPRELLRVFGIGVQHVFERPTRGACDAEGVERVSVVDLALLMICLERCGLAVDPFPLCQALAPTLGAKRLLTGPELHVYWRAQRRPDGVLQISSPKLTIGCGDGFTTPAGYTVRAFYESEPECDCGEERSDVSMLTIAPPATSTKAAKVHSTAARRQLRKYLGEPRAGRSPSRKPPPSSAA